MLPFFVMFSLLFFFMALGIPVAFAFGATNILTIFLFVGPHYINILYTDCFASLANFLYIAFPLFILMGELFHHSGVAEVMVRILKDWVKWLPGSLGITTVIGCGIFGAISGSGMAACATFGAVMIPPMLKSNYPIRMTTGIIAVGGVLDFFIPPNAITVIYAVLAQASIAKLLIGGITPGVILTILFAIYVGIRMKISPAVSVSYVEESAKISYLKLLIDTLKNFLPLLSVVFAVTVTIYLGIATPSEAAAAGVVMSVILIAFYGRLSLRIVKAALMESMITTCMIFFIMVGSSAFSHLLFFTGSSSKVISLITGINLSPFMIGVIMCVIVLILGCFIDVISIMFITLPIFNPIVDYLGLDKTWFGLIYLYCIAMGAITPPFGVNLFVTKSVSPPEIKLEDVYRGVLPFILICLAVLALLYLVPGLLTYLPNKVMQ